MGTGEWNPPIRPFPSQARQMQIWRLKKHEE
jgi:hypothetical protein